MKPVHLVSVVFGVALAVAAGCQTTNENFCCSNEASCTANGANAEITPCTDSTRPYCDDDGEFGPGRTCIPDPGATPCGGPGDCTNPDRPFCIDGACAQCETADNCAADEPVCSTDGHLCGPCTDSADCETRQGATHCFVDDGACVACLEDNHCTNLDAPICDDTDHACRGCLADDECASQVCDLTSGECVPEGDVIYLSPTGAGVGTCTRGSPCNSFALGLAAVGGTRHTIKAAAGAYTGPITISGLSVSILGAGASTEPGASGVSAIAISGGADVSINGLLVTGTLSTTGLVPGVTCSGSTLRLQRARVLANTGGGGVALQGCQFSLVNNVIALNGTTTSAFGGVRITDVTSTGLQEFQFNTVTSNTSVANTVAGVECASIAVPVTLESSIVHGNVSSGTGRQVGDDADCVWNYSDIEQAVTGTGNVDEDPMFVDVANRDFHLQDDSPIRDLADPDAEVAVDIDGDSRPQGDRADIGADEVTR